MPYKHIQDKRAAFKRWYHKNKKRHIQNVRRREKIRKKTYKKRLIEMLGGSCMHCGYNACIESLDFNHTEPATKEIEVSELLRKPLHGSELSGKLASVFFCVRTATAKSITSAEPKCI